jgi:hypothetical protein
MQSVDMPRVMAPTKFCLNFRRKKMSILIVLITAVFFLSWCQRYKTFYNVIDNDYWVFVRSNEEPICLGAVYRNRVVVNNINKLQNINSYKTFYNVIDNDYWVFVRSNEKPICLG